MSVNGSLDEELYGVTLKVPETLMAELIKKGEKPANILTKVLQRIASEMTTDEILEYAESTSTGVEIQKPQSKHKRNGIDKWEESDFRDFMSKLLERTEGDPDTADLMSMLLAYISTGPRPTSKELREARDFGPSEMWQEELRVSKSKLTIAAKHMGLPSFFPNAYGSGNKRKHPMSNDFYNFLKKWYDENKGIAMKYEKLASPRSVL